MSIVYYVMDGDDILVSTMDARAKAGAVRRHPKVSLCVLDEKWPPTYVVVYADAIVETDEDAVVDLMMRIAGVMAGNPMPESVRPMVAQGANERGPCRPPPAPLRHVLHPAPPRQLDRGPARADARSLGQYSLVAHEIERHH